MILTALIQKMKRKNASFTLKMLNKPSKSFIDTMHYYLAMDYWKYVIC